MAEYRRDSFCFLWVSTLSRSVKTQNERGQYPAILTLRLVIATTLWDARRLALGIWDGKSLYLPTQVSFSTVHKKIYKKCPDTGQTEISLRRQFKLEPHPHWSPFGI